MIQTSRNSTPDTSLGLTRQIAEALRNEIIYGRLDVDQKLPSESDLASRFGASQATIREAMKLLAAQQLIRSKRGPRGGIFVNRPTLGQANRLLTGITTWLVTLGVFSLEDIAESRRHIGGICVRLAANRRGSPDLEVMERELLRQSDASLSNEDFCASDVRFHHAIADATGNKVLQFIMLVINDSLTPATNMMVFKFREREAIIDFNERILAAIQSRRIGPSEDAFNQLMDYLSEKYEHARKSHGTRRQAAG